VAFHLPDLDRPHQRIGLGSPYNLYEGSSIDETVLCTSTTCYLFFANDNGNIYRRRCDRQFSGTFTNATTIMTTQGKLFEPCRSTRSREPTVLMIVEAMAAQEGISDPLPPPISRFVDSLQRPRAILRRQGQRTFSGTAGRATSVAEISFATIRRAQTIDPCNLQLLYQGVVPTTGFLITAPWQPGLLTLVQ